MEKIKLNQNPPKTAKNPKKIIQTKQQKSKSTRFQDNYFNTKLHKHNWEPSGKYKEKGKYTYGDSGLGFNLGEKNITKQNDKKNANKTQTHFLEFDFLENNLCEPFLFGKQGFQLHFEYQLL